MPPSQEVGRRVTCGVCGRSIVVRKDGTLRSHRRDSWTSWCQGSYRPPMPPEVSR
jgi:hypothetical protein